LFFPPGNLSYFYKSINQDLSVEKNCMLIERLIAILFIITLSNSAFTQQKTITTTRTGDVIRIDGIINEEAWESAAIASDFITYSPNFGKPATKPTEVRVLYDDHAMYIAARLYDDPDKISKQFTKRDVIGTHNVDYFTVFLDTYDDDQNAYQFLVTSRNVQSDSRVSSTSSGFALLGDVSWDAVWESQVNYDELGWTVEIRIPFFSLRFSNQSEQKWGIQFGRYIRRETEISYWSPVDIKQSGFINYFGTLEGLKDIKAPLRLSFSPYISTGYRNNPVLNGKAEENTMFSGGMDLKYGINESFTLDMTLIPDFNQTISDNVINNISPFEVYFSENRQFFTEGTELFNKSGIFYSRRIGKTPSDYHTIRNRTNSGDLSDYELIRNPEVTRLLNAFKFSGRTKNNLGIGVFNAIGQPSKALLRNTLTGSDTVIKTDVLTNYNVVVLDQALKNRSFVTFTNTNVLRSGSRPDANVTAIDLSLYDKNIQYNFQLRPKYSKIFDSQGGSEGYSNLIKFSKVSGKFRFGLSNEIYSASYNPNDLGFLYTPNQVYNKGEFYYIVLDPTEKLLRQEYGFNFSQNYLYKPFVYQETEFNLTAFWWLKNFWDMRLTVGTIPFWFNDYFEMQTPSNIYATPRQNLRRAPQYYFYYEGSTDSRKKFYINWYLQFAEGPLPDDPYSHIELGGRYRFSDKFNLFANFARRHDNGQFGYAFARDAGQPLLARRIYTDLTSYLEGSYNFDSRINLSFRVRHFWNKIDNTNIYNVTPDGNWTERPDLNPKNYNDNYNAFNIDVFLTWDFSLGSRIVLGWKNWLGMDYEYYIDGSRYNNYIKNAGKIFATPHGNDISLKFIYFLNYSDLTKKK